jgi:hypothetical protein
MFCSNFSRCLISAENAIKTEGDVSTLQVHDSCATNNTTLSHKLVADILCTVIWFDPRHFQLFSPRLCFLCLSLLQFSFYLILCDLFALSFIFPCFISNCWVSDCLLTWHFIEQPHSLQEYDNNLSRNKQTPVAKIKSKAQLIVL